MAACGSTRAEAGTCASAPLPRAHVASSPASCYHARTSPQSLRAQPAATAPARARHIACALRPPGEITNARVWRGARMPTWWVCILRVPRASRNDHDRSPAVSSHWHASKCLTSTGTANGARWVGADAVEAETETEAEAEAEAGTEAEAHPTQAPRAARRARGRRGAARPRTPYHEPPGKVGASSGPGIPTTSSRLSRPRLALLPMRMRAAGRALTSGRRPLNPHAQIFSINAPPASRGRALAADVSASL